MTETLAGWPQHRPKCPGSEALVRSWFTTVNAQSWRIRRCTRCGEVAMSRGGGS